MLCDSCQSNAIHLLLNIRGLVHAVDIHSLGDKYGEKYFSLYKGINFINHRMITFDYDCDLRILR